MLRVALNRIVYIAIVAIIFFMIIKGFWFIALTIPFIGIVSERIFWKNFYAAKRHMTKQRDKSAVETFKLFLDDLEAKPWIKYFQILNFGIYSHNLKAKVYNNMGICYLESGIMKTAEEYFKKSLEEDSHFCLPHYNLAIVNLVKKEEDKAKEHLDMSKKLGYNRIQIEQLKGYVYVKYHMNPSDLLR